MLPAGHIVTDLQNSLLALAAQPKKLIQAIFILLKYMSPGCLIFCTIGLAHSIFKWITKDQWVSYSAVEPLETIEINPETYRNWITTL